MNTPDYIRLVKKGVDEGTYTPEQGEEMISFALEDDLTGLHGKRSLEYNVRKGLERVMTSKRKSRGLSVIYMDLDRFKPINDRYGHEKGDYALKQFAKVLERACRREGDHYVHRPHGDEFVVILHDTDRAGAESVLERICESFASRKNALKRRLRMQKDGETARNLEYLQDIDDFSFTAGISTITPKEAGSIPKKEIGDYASSMVNGADKKMLLQKTGR
jgi:diguanylate cyclase (GGDEF)-like protein